ncbi:MAG: DUF2950 family protein [Acidobacteria bacterium]|nr:DUF2950 family protein [Acidobacteriota bacterium]
MPSYEGYVFRILRAQGPAAPGGAHGYVINGNMIAGHALIAYPVKWGETGVMTFMCSHHGDLYQKNVGPSATPAASRIKKLHCIETDRDEPLRVCQSLYSAWHLSEKGLVGD